jgi:hypothetical protein
MSNPSKIRSPHSDGWPGRLNQSDAPRRQPVQIAGGAMGLYALANDGTIWWLYSHDPAYWVSLPRLPQDDLPEENGINV